jgi:hypothetical protein
LKKKQQKTLYGNINVYVGLVGMEKNNKLKQKTTTNIQIGTQVKNKENMFML